MSYIILDLDGVVSDDQWRLKYIKHDESDLWLKYVNYHNRCATDEIKNKHLFIDVEEDIIMFTSRPYKYAFRTLLWMEQHRVDPDIILMRPNNNHEPSAVLKRRFLNMLPPLGVSNITCAYDDRNDVIKMYIEEGVNCKQIKIYEGDNGE